MPTKYGTKEEYLAAVRALQGQGLAVLADVVLNHRICLLYTSPVTDGDAGVRLREGRRVVDAIPHHQYGVPLPPHSSHILLSLIHISTTPTKGVTMRSAAPATVSAKSMACPSLFPAGTRARAILSIRRNRTAPATRRSCAPPSTGSCPAAPTWRTCSAASSGKGTN